MKHEEIFRTQKQVGFLISLDHRNLTPEEKERNNALLYDYALTNLINTRRHNAYPNIEMDTPNMVVIIELL